MAQFKGAVRWFNKYKGFGFLECKGANDVFVHYTGIKRDGYKNLLEGEEVTYDIEVGPEGKRQAANVVSLRNHPRAEGD